MSKLNLHGLSPVEDWIERVNELESELTAIREFVRSLRQIDFEEWYGDYQNMSVIKAGGVVAEILFTIRDGEGNFVTSGKDALDAWESRRKEA